MAATDRIIELLSAAASGSRIATGSEPEVIGPPGGPPAAAVLGFTGHTVVAASVPQAWVAERLSGEAPFGALNPRFIVALGERLDLASEAVDVTMAARGLSGEAALTEIDAVTHPRVLRALSHRTDVRAYVDAGEAATVVVGRGLALRLEVAFEVQEDDRGRGHGRRALVEARRLIAAGELLFAQCAPGNAASLRALLGAGFQPIGSEVLLFER